MVPKIVLVGGARPNFMKIAPLCRVLDTKGVEYILVHTGQHYDDNMSDVFFREFGLKKPDWHLGVGSGTHAYQTAKIMQAFENVCKEEHPDIVITVGDVNSTLACALVTSKIKETRLAHVEAGGRSFDRSMPEEINRIVTDVLSDYLFAIEPSHVTNLINEGILSDKIFLVGDTMVDTLLHINISARFSTKPYILVTTHRDSNVDSKENLENILKAFETLSHHVDVIFPTHPHTLDSIFKFDLEHYLSSIDYKEPMGYFEFMSYLKGALALLTDSGGAQIEAAVLGVPCITMRESTERTMTIESGVNTLVGTDTNRIVRTAIEYVKNPSVVRLNTINKKLVDGRAAERIVGVLLGGKYE